MPGLPDRNPFDAFDGILVINRDVDLGRWVTFMEQARKYGFADRVVRFSAITHPDGAYGCSLSHRECLRSAAANKWKNVLIFEDDVKFLYPKEYVYNTLNRALGSLYSLDGDWDLFYIGMSMRVRIYDPSEHHEAGDIIHSNAEWYGRFAFAVNSRSFGLLEHIPEHALFKREHRGDVVLRNNNSVKKISVWPALAAVFPGESLTNPGMVAVDKLLVDKYLALGMADSVKMLEHTTLPRTAPSPDTPKKTAGGGPVNTSAKVSSAPRYLKKRGESISVILNVYRRPHTLQRQIEAVLSQSCKVSPEDIHVWYNPSDVPPVYPEDKRIKTYAASWNTKYWGRFTLPLLCRTDYVAVFDDDVFPQKNWFRNCINTIENPDTDGILGGSGIILPEHGYRQHTKVGWNGLHLTSAREVDLVGHAWFFRQSCGRYLWCEPPATWENGEDIMFSYLAQKYGQVSTFVPPHPETDKTLWCTSFSDSSTIGSDAAASYLQNPQHMSQRDDCVEYCKRNGWQIINSANGEADVTPVKTFKGDLIKFFNKILSGENFALSRWGDGEIAILEGKPLNLLNKGNGEFDNRPDDPKYALPKVLLEEAFVYRSPEYYLGIPCPCCSDLATFNKVKRMSGQREENLTWANIFVNSNYSFYVERLLPAIAERKVVLVSHRDTALSGLFFKPLAHYRVPPNAWIKQDVTRTLLNDFSGKSGYIFLFAAGPYSNIAIYEMYKANKNNTYLDVGSTLDVMLGLKPTRRYLLGGSILNKTCKWGNSIRGCDAH